MVISQDIQFHVDIYHTSLHSLFTIQWLAFNRTFCTVRPHCTKVRNLDKRWIMESEKIIP